MKDFLGCEGVSVVVVSPPLLLLLLLLARLGFSHSTIHPYFSSAHLKGKTLIIFIYVAKIRNIRGPTVSYRYVVESEPSHHFSQQEKFPAHVKVKAKYRFWVEGYGKQNYSSNCSS